MLKADIINSTVYDLEFLHKYAKTFPDTAMTDFIDDYCRWFKLPLPEPEDDADVEAEKDEKAKAEKQSKKEKFQRWRKKKSGPNARERRKARRQAGKEGVLAEDLDQEERDELISSMTVCPELLNLQACSPLNRRLLEIARPSEVVRVCPSGHGEDLDPRGGLGQRRLVR